MYDPIFMQHVTAAVHEDRARNLQRSRSSRTDARIGFIRQTLSLWPQATRTQATSSHATHKAVPNRG